MPSPIRVFYDPNGRDVLPQEERTLRGAISDPGAYVSRRYQHDDDGAVVYEDLTTWQARAVAAAIKGESK